MTNSTMSPGGLTRRAAVFLGSASLAALALRPAFALETLDEAALADLERREGGRLGVCVFDTAANTRRGHRSDEPFALCSTFKFLLAAAILQRVDAGSVSLDRAIAVAKGDILGNSPVTEKHIGQTMTIGELCHATMTLSDNAAANLLLKEIGGPETVTGFLRAIGDSVTRLDRYEPGMNNPDIAAGDTRDTTSPAAMAATMQTIVLGDVLSADSRGTIAGWLKAARTGKTRLQAGFPSDWITGDKTGTGSEGQTNDVAIAWPPGRAPLIVTVYYERKGRSMKDNAAVIAEVGRIVSRGV